MTIVNPRSIVDVDVVCAVLGRISCNGAMKRVPGCVVCTGGFVSEGVRVIWSRIYIV